MSHIRLRFGREVLGPIFAEFTLRLWVYLSSLDLTDDTALLFCARGGLRLQFLYDRFLAATGLESPVYTNNLMVSRVVAVRPALISSANSAFEQLAYEFSGNSLRQLAKAISRLDPIEAGGSADVWERRYTRSGLADVLRSEAGRSVRNGIQVQADRFQSHLHLRSDGRPRIVLCDTGLFGSTMQLLEEGIPGIAWSSCLFARANYKHLPVPHFARTVGLCMEADQYSPLHARTAVLRYWHLIESVLEPDLPSVVHFDDDAGTPRSNLEIQDWKTRVAPAPGTIFAGVVAYFDALPAGAASSRIVTDAQAAWRVLRHTIVWPRRADAESLDAGLRADDYGRDRTFSVQSEPNGLLGALRNGLWREGEVARISTTLRPLLQLGIETAYSARWCWRTARTIALG
jgi:hypothetical protein